jgi:hypothetical protein
MMRLLLIVVAFSFAYLAEAQPSASQSATPDDIARLRWLDHADVKADFHRVVEEQHDMRFLAVGSEARYIPAGRYKTDQLVAKYGSRNLAVGCVISGDEALRLREKADAYANEYNQMLVRYLRSHQ